MPYSFAISPDGKILACGADYDRGLLLYDLESGKPIRQIVPEDGARTTIRSLAFSPDGKTLAFSSYSYSRSGSTTELVAWDMERHRPRWKNARGGHSLAFSPDGRFIAGKAGSRLSVWESRTGKEITEGESIAAAATQELAFSSDGI